MTVLQIIRDTPVTSRQNIKKAEVQIGDWSPQDETDVANRGSEPPESATDAVNLDRSPKADADGVNEDRSLENDQCQDCKNDTRPSLQYPTMCNVASSKKNASTTGLRFRTHTLASII